MSTAADDGAMFEVAPHEPKTRAPRARVGPLAFVLSQPTPGGRWYVVDNSGTLRDPATAWDAMDASRVRRTAVADSIAPDRCVLFVTAHAAELAQHGLSWPLSKEKT